MKLNNENIVIFVIRNSKIKYSVFLSSIFSFYSLKFLSICFVFSLNIHSCLEIFNSINLKFLNFLYRFIHLYVVWLFHFQMSRFRCLFWRSFRSRFRSRFCLVKVIDTISFVSFDIFIVISWVVVFVSICSKKFFFLNVKVLKVYCFRFLKSWKQSRDSTKDEFCIDKKHFY